MKKLSIHSASVTLSLALFSHSEIALAKDPINIYKVCKVKSEQPVSLYTDPTKHSAIVAKLPANSRWLMKLKAQKKYSHSRWQKVIWNNQTGWLKNSCLELDKKRTKIYAKNPQCFTKNTRTKDCN